jgi:hypothetical protein
MCQESRIFINVINLPAAVNRRNQTPNEDKGAALLDHIVSKFLLILQSRLKKTKAIIVQIFVVMMSSEAESEQIISLFQEMEFGIEGL